MATVAVAVGILGGGRGLIMKVTPIVKEADAYFVTSVMREISIGSGSVTIALWQNHQAGRGRIFSVAIKTALFTLATNVTNGMANTGGQDSGGLWMCDRMRSQCHSKRVRRWLDEIKKLEEEKDAVN